MTPTEFAVLDHLVEHAGQLVTHRQLLDSVWPGMAIEPQVVKNKIFHLRRVLEDEPKRPQYIETLPRRGDLAVQHRREPPARIALDDQLEAPVRHPEVEQRDTRDVARVGERLKRCHRRRTAARR